MELHEQSAYIINYTSYLLFKKVLNSKIEHQFICNTEHDESLYNNVWQAPLLFFILIISFPDYDLRAVMTYIH